MIQFLKSLCNVCLPVILLILNEDAMPMLKPFQLMFSGNASYQTSNNLLSVSQKLVHNQHKHNQQNWVLPTLRAKFSREMDFVTPW